MFDMAVGEGEIGPLIMPVAGHIPPVPLIPEIDLDGDAELGVHDLVLVHIQEDQQSRHRRIQDLREFLVVREGGRNIVRRHQSIDGLAQVITPQAGLA